MAADKEAYLDPCAKWEAGPYPKTNGTPLDPLGPLTYEKLSLTSRPVGQHCALIYVLESLRFFCKELIIGEQERMSYLSIVT